MSQSNEGKIKDVYSDNFESELRKISSLIDEYNFVSMVIINVNLGYGIPWNSLPSEYKQPLHK